MNPVSWACAGCGAPVVLDLDRSALDPDSAHCADCEPRDRGIPVLSVEDDPRPEETPIHPLSRLTADEEIDHPDRTAAIRNAEVALEAATSPAKRREILTSLSDKALRRLGYFSFDRYAGEEPAA